MYYQTVDYYLPDGTPVLSLQAYLDRRAAGALDRSREYWLFHDEMIADRLEPPKGDFDRLTWRRAAASRRGGIAPLAVANRARRQRAAEPVREFRRSFDLPCHEIR